MNRYLSLPVIAVSLAAILPATADETRTKVVKFAKGKNSATISSKVTGRESVIYKLNAREGQFLKVSLRPNNPLANYNIYIPGRSLGDEAMFTSASGGREYLGQLYKTGEHSISVFLTRAAARRGEAAKFDIVFTVTDKAPEQDKEKPTAGAVPKKVTDDCLAALRKQVGRRGMKVLKSKRGGNSFVVDVKVEGVANPWRCFHDGTKCTGTEYQGEG
ncbi:MAG: hypothetical protein ACR2RV_17835 [Verrucomicrobiales bacterium]